MDCLSPLFARFSLSAEVFYSGALCGAVDFPNDRGIGMLHVLRKGTLRVIHANGERLEVSAPTLLFYRQASVHRFEVDDPAGCDLVCAYIEFGAGMGLQILSGLPHLLRVPMNDIAGVQPTLDLLFAEAFSARAGRGAAIDRLVEYFTILLLRHSVEASLVKKGVLAGLADERVAKAMMVMHSQPEHAWTLEALAGVAAMSRSRFAKHFLDTVGTTVMDYLTDWRISLAQGLLKRGRPVKAVAPAVGYTNETAFARVFARRTGVSPTNWTIKQVNK
jgi:AraC-like DNA-binding protein